MAIVNLKGSLVMTDLEFALYQKVVEVALNGGRVRMSIDTVEAPAAVSDTSTFLMHRLPSNARILPGSKIYHDDLASTGSPTIDVGVYAYKNNLASADDVDALTAGIDVTTAGEADMVLGIQNWGKRLWEFVNGETSDPGGLLDIKLVLDDADANTGGTITSIVFYTID